MPGRYAHPSAAPQVPWLVPAAADEGCHEPGDEPLWSESWYADAVSEDGGLGVYVRLGRLPGEGVALCTVAVVGPGRPAVLLVRPAAPLPAAGDPAQRVETDGLAYAQHCEQPLERFRVVVSGRAEAFADESAPLRGEAGSPVDLALDAVWTTAGVPYRWRRASRYEIPCTIEGTVRVGEETMPLRGVGQRDHSWGARDWFASDWMWNALHLDDGTHTHAVTLPARPGFAVGYVQRGSELHELRSGAATETLAADGLIARASVTLGPPPLAYEVEPLAFGALRLDAPDGRSTHFPRAMCRVRTADGRDGVGWIEWNRNQRS